MLQKPQNLVSCHLAQLRKAGLVTSRRSSADGRDTYYRIQLIVDDINAEVARLTEAGVPFRNAIVDGPGGSQVLVVDPEGNLIELFQPAAR